MQEQTINYKLISKPHKDVNKQVDSLQELWKLKDDKNHQYRFPYKFQNQCTHTQVFSHFFLFGTETIWLLPP